MKGTLLLVSMALGLLVCGATWTQNVASADPDATPPRVARTVPVPRMTCVDPTSNLSAFFSEDVRASSVNDTAVRLYRKDSATGVAFSVRYGAVRERAIVDPAGSLEGGVTYKMVVDTRVEDPAGNRLDQNGTRDGLQPKMWTFTTSASSEKVTECRQFAAQAHLRNASVAADACAASSTDGSYADCTTVAQLRPYGFEPTVGVTVNGINGDSFDWSAAMQHRGGGSAYTFATFGDHAGQVTEAPRDTGVSPLPAMIAEWEALAQIDTRNAATAANLYAADNNGDYTGLTLAALVSEGFVQSPNVTTVVTVANPNHVVIESVHDYGSRAYRFDSATGTTEPVPG